MDEEWNAPALYSPTSVVSGSYGEYGRICVQLPWLAVMISLCVSSKYKPCGSCNSVARPRIVRIGASRPVASRRKIEIAFDCWIDTAISSRPGASDTSHDWCGNVSMRFGWTLPCAPYEKTVIRSPESLLTV